MPKITRLGGPSIAPSFGAALAAARSEQETPAPAVAADPEPELAGGGIVTGVPIGEDGPPGLVLPPFDGQVLRESRGTGIPMVGVEVPADGTIHELTVEGGDDLSAGKSSATSSPKTTSTSGKKAPGRPKPARTTGNRSKQARTAPGTASSTDTSGPATGSEPSDQPA